MWCDWDWSAATTRKRNAGCASCSRNLDSEVQQVKQCNHVVLNLHLKLQLLTETSFRFQPPLVWCWLCLTLVYQMLLSYLELSGICSMPSIPKRCSVEQWSRNSPSELLPLSVCFVNSYCCRFLWTAAAVRDFHAYSIFSFLFCVFGFTVVLSSTTGLLPIRLQK